MKIPSLRLLLLAGVVAMPVCLQAQPTAHYVPGFEGIKGASLPPPGVYLRDYNIIYTAGKLNNASGNEINLPDPGFNLLIYGQVPRVLWITDMQVLGGFLGFDALIPLLYKHVEVPGLDDGNFGIGDLFAESTLSWHPKKFDLAVGFGLHMPTGNSGQPSDAGLGYWTPMFTAGATWYIDEEKTWAVSALNRYEFNSESRDTDGSVGEVYTLEWGISKTLAKVYDVGLAGYWQQQVTKGSGTLNAGSRASAAAIGPEVSMAIPKCMSFVSFRYDYEFAAENRAQGHTLSLTLTHRF
jgi:hypothetical protein